ncbi:MAG: hypothetical protein OSB00_13000, partial [Sphingomonas bacterium]|nr:hypothetical protein [Sphingomonas bacterium]
TGSTFSGVGASDKPGAVHLQYAPPDSWPLVIVRYDLDTINARRKAPTLTAAAEFVGRDL